MSFRRADQLASADAEPLDEAALPPLSAVEKAQVDSLGAVRSSLEDEAKGWAVQLAELAALGFRAQRAGGSARRTLPLELAGSWRISQHTAERWLAEAERVTGTLPRTLAMLGRGELLRHQAVAILHGTDGALAEIATAVEAGTVQTPATAGTTTRHSDLIRSRRDCRPSLVCVGHGRSRDDAEALSRRVGD